MANYNQILEDIHRSISDNDMENLSDVLDTGYNVLPKSPKYKSALCFGYQVLAKHSTYNEPVQAISAMDRARLQFPRDMELLSDEFDLLVGFIQSQQESLSSLENEFIDKLIDVILCSVPESSKIKAYSISEPVKNSLSKKSEDSDEQNIDVKVQELGKRLYFNLNDKMRNDIVKILTPYIPNLNEGAIEEGIYKEKKRKKKKSKKP